jgi:Integrase core domain
MIVQSPTLAEWLAQQIVEAFPWDTAPSYLLRDNDRAYGQAFAGRIRAMGIRDRPISPRSPWQYPYVERLIGTLRRDCLDHVVIFGEQDLRRILTLYSLYYNETRTHLGLSKDTPLRRAIERSGMIVSVPILSGLHHRYMRIRFSGRTPVSMRDAEEIERAVTTFSRLPHGGLIIVGAPSVAVHRDLIVALAARHRLPAVYPFRFWVAIGGLISYGPDAVEPFRRAAAYVDRIFKGEKPADLPVQRRPSTSL